MVKNNLNYFIDLTKLKSGARIFFSGTSQGHNTLPWPGLEPGSSDWEPSALTTGLLNKAVVLACPRYSWPLMLKVAPCTVIWLYDRTSKFFWLDGLLLFCIIMGLRSVSSAIIMIFKPDLARRVNHMHFQAYHYYTFCYFPELISIIHCLAG